MNDEVSRLSPQQRQPHPDLMKIRNKVVGECSICGGTGHIDQHQCSCMDEMMAICWLDKAGVLPEYWHYTLAGLPVSGELKQYLSSAVDAYANDRRNWKALNLHIYGSYRVGKTTTATCLMKEFIKKQSFASCGYVTARELSISAKGRDQGETDLEYLADLDLLVIEELGKESADKFVAEAFIAYLDVLLRQRRGSRATVIISNLTPEKLTQRYGVNIGLILENDFIPLDFTQMPKLGVTNGH